MSQIPVNSAVASVHTFYITYTLCREVCSLNVHVL